MTVSILRKINRKRVIVILSTYVIKIRRIIDYYRTVKY